MWSDIVPRHYYGALAAPENQQMDVNVNLPMPRSRTVVGHLWEQCRSRKLPDEAQQYNLYVPNLQTTSSSFSREHRCFYARLPESSVRSITWVARYCFLMSIFQPFSSTPPSSISSMISRPLDDGGISIFFRRGKTKLVV